MAGSVVEPSGPEGTAAADTSGGTDGEAIPGSAVEPSVAEGPVFSAQQPEAEVSAAIAEHWTAVDPDDEPLFAWFDAALVEAVTADSLGQVASELVGAEQQGAD